MSAPIRNAEQSDSRPGVLSWPRGLQVSAVAALLLAACGQRISNANLEVVNREFETSDGAKNGVSPKEVEAILGPPKRVESYRLELETQKKELDGLRYYYEQDGQTIELHFLDNKLISKVPMLDTPKQTAEKPTP